MPAYVLYGSAFGEQAFMVAMLAAPLMTYFACLHLMNGAKLAICFLFWVP